MITSHSDGSVVIWDLKKFEAIKEIQLHQQDCRYIDISPSKGYFASAGFDNHIVIYDLK